MRLHRFPFKAMGSPCEIQLFAKTRSRAEKIAIRAIQEVERLERRYSRYRNDSRLSEINRIAMKGGKIRVDDETASVLNYASTCYQQSDGLFDITSGILRRAWRFDRGELPDDGLIRNLLARIGWSKVYWDPPILEFPVAGMELDFGGIVKEYAADRTAQRCQESGIRHGLVNLGGDIKLIGPRADGKAWRVGVPHPRRKDALAATLFLRDGGIASSGDYERCILVDGVRYSHVLSPRTGWPVRFLASVSVVSEFCVVAGSASTIAMLKEEQGPAWLEELGLPHLWIDAEGKIGGSLSHSANPD